MKLAFLLFLLVLPFAAAHGSAEDPGKDSVDPIFAEPAEDFGPIGGPNDLSRLLPWTWALRDNWTMTVVVILLWVVTLKGLWELSAFVIARLFK